MKGSSSAESRRISIAVLALGFTTSLAGLPTLARAQDASVADQGGLGEIIVTAQRREESLQDVPISVTAITNETLQAVGIGGTTSISQIVPSVQVTSSGPSSIFFMRGVGNTSGNVGEEGANAFYIDGVYLGDLTSVGTKFNNIQRVEVLKGPQGTLFGRNSSGGLVNIITREPGDETAIEGRVGYGNYDTWQGQLYAATPVSENFSADIALTAKHQNHGFGTNLATGEDVGLGWYWGARSKLVWRPGEATKVVLSGDYYKDHNDYVNGFYLTKGSVGVGGYQYPGDYNLNTLDNGFAHIQTYGGSLTVEHEFDFATLTSITARRGVEVESSFDADYTNLRLAYGFVPSRIKSFQQELRLASASTRPFNWQLGLFYYNATANVDGFTVTATPIAATTTIITNEMKTDSYAIFGEAGYDITPTTHIIGGIRYTKDKRSLEGRIENFVSGALISAPAKQKLSTGKATFRVALRQDLSEDINVYASFNRGFKSGIFGATGNPADPPVRPQTIDAFEVGLKSQLFDNMVRFNLAGFHYKIDDYQVRASPAPGRTLLLNAATVKVDGIEGELTIAPAEGLTLSLNATYLDSRFTSFPGAQFTYQRPAEFSPGVACDPARGPTPSQQTGPATGGGIACFGDASGKTTPLSPKFAFSAGVQYRTPLGDNSELIFNALWNHSSKIFFEPDNRLSQKAYDVVNLAFELRPNPNWGIELWGNNVLDKHYYQTGVGGTSGDHGEYAPPRTYGVNVKFDF